MNLFELFVKIGVDDQASGQLSNITTKLGDGIAKASKIGVSAITTFGTIAVKSFAEYEQLVGGVDTLFKDASQKVQQYEADAYKTAGMSANDYMANATAFSASLISSLGGDTAKAAEYANTAMVSMSDNANKMGTDIESIVATYQSLARGNYAMLDNLKLGYGGTKAELERLIQDASTYTDVQKEMGLTVDESSMSFDNIVNAIAVVQGHLGIAGATAEEAATTIEGSFLSMKAAASNFMVSLVDDDASVTDSFNVMKETAITFVDNVTPKIMEFLGAISPIATTVAGMTGAFVAFKTAAAISTLLTTLTTAWQAYAIANEGATVAQWLLNAAMNANPIVLVVTLLAGLVAAMVTLWHTNDDLRETLINAWNAVKEKADNVWNGVLKFFKEDIPEALAKVINFVEKNWSSLLLLLTNPIAGALALLYDLNPEFKEWVDGVKEAIVDGFSGLAQSALTWGKDLLDNFIFGIKSKWDDLKNTVGQTAQSIKDYLGFSEPEKGPLSNFHTYAPDMMDLFIKGIRDNEGKLQKQIAETFNFGEDIVNGGFDGSFGRPTSSGHFGTHVVQNIYSKAQTAADLMEEALYQQEMAVMLGV